MHKPIVISLVAQKGGVGKTTLAVNLAAEAERDHWRARVLDIDPQGSATIWADARERERPDVRTCLARRLERDLADAVEDGIDAVFVDTAPHAEGAALTAARIADLVLVPCRPALFDLAAVGASLELAGIAGTPAAVALNGVPPRGRTGREAREALERRGVRVLAATVGHRAAVGHAQTAGLGVVEHEPRGRAADEIRALWSELAVVERPDFGRVPELRLIHGSGGSAPADAARAGGRP